jgi:hypothetical protein
MSGDDVNTYLKELAGLEITAKDFRTWHATVLAVVALAVSQSVARSETAGAVPSPGRRARWPGTSATHLRSAGPPTSTRE